jgi:hypothetical protein
VQRNISRNFQLLVTVGLLCFPASLPLRASMAERANTASVSTNTLNWQSRAKLRRGFKAATGTLIFNDKGIAFRSDDARASLVWPYVEVRTFAITSNRLVLTDYGNRDHHLPGERRFRFEADTPVPASIASELSRRINKPDINGDPDPQSITFFTIPARHGTRFGGTNGTLRFREDGIDYVAPGGGDSRSWRWADIQTLANPTPYQLRVGGYRETYEFDLKQPMSRDLFDRLWDHVYTQDLNVGNEPGGHRRAE